MKKVFRKIGLLLAMTLIVAAMNAQTPPHPGGGSAPGSGDPPVGSPIDGGLSVMLILGAAYGYAKQKKK